VLHNLPCTRCVDRITQLLSVSTPANRSLVDSPLLTPYKNLMPVLYTEAGGGELLRVGLTSLTARGTVLIITLIGPGGHFVSKKPEWRLCFCNCLKRGSIFSSCIWGRQSTSVQPISSIHSLSLRVPIIPLTGTSMLCVRLTGVAGYRALPAAHRLVGAAHHRADCLNRSRRSQRCVTVPQLLSWRQCRRQTQRRRVLRC